MAWFSSSSFCFRSLKRIYGSFIDAEMYETSHSWCRNVWFCELSWEKASDSLINRFICDVFLQLHYTEKGLDLLLK